MSIQIPERRRSKLHVSTPSGQIGWFGGAARLRVRLCGRTAISKRRARCREVSRRSAAFRQRCFSSLQKPDQELKTAHVARTTHTP
ncbi:unnamed protein product [Pieris brassicae]|uniref:Uncharacterized protein n=1 Tax=Pieris brassicae TaxID=7116 RepID=A0A9P0U3X9_PIEBR|nr:unnamed protein product [Pieris brassicae]